MYFYRRQWVRYSTLHYRYHSTVTTRRWNKTWPKRYKVRMFVKQTNPLKTEQMSGSR